MVFNKLTDAESTAKKLSDQYYGIFSVVPLDQKTKSKGYELHYCTNGLIPHNVISFYGRSVLKCTQSSGC